MSYTCTESTDADLEEVVEQWGQHLTDNDRNSLRDEINVDGRQIYVVRNTQTGGIDAVFDLQNVLNLFSKNLVIFFSPEVVKSDDGLTPDEVDSAGILLVTIFTELIRISCDQDLKRVKIRSDDRVLLACFYSFASHLAGSGKWKAKAYKNWIELEEVSVAA